MYKRTQQGQYIHIMNETEDRTS